jgi:Ca2+-binding RTX toxin-like protein
VALAALVAALAGSAPASAGTVRSFDRYRVNERGDSVLDDRLVSFEGGAGENNVLSVSREGDAVVLVDAGAPLRAADGCVSSDEHTARCQITFKTYLMVIRAGDGDDRVSLAGGLGLSPQVQGGVGDDHLSSAGGASLHGDSGNDELVGSPSGDQLEGGSGDDRLRGGGGSDSLAGDYEYRAQPFAPGRDFIDGGEGIDTASYAAHRVPTSIDLERRNGQGAYGENDSLVGIENVRGGRGGGVMRGDDGPNLLFGHDGYGGPSGPGSVIDGHGGDDLLFGSSGSDTIAGGDGADYIAAGQGLDRASGGPGDDLLDLGVAGVPSAPRRASARCGTGTDRVAGVAAPILVTRDCESILSVWVTAFPAGVVVRPKYVDVPLSNAGTPERGPGPVEPPCGVAVTLSGADGDPASPSRIGRAGGGLAANGSARVVRVLLTAAGRRLLARPGTTPVRITLATHQGCNPGEVRTDNPSVSFSLSL